MYKSTHLRQSIIINRIISVHYFEYFSDFSFPGETHDFWEFLCVDKGEILVKADNQIHALQKGDIIFHKPNEFHNVCANGQIAPNLVVIAFECSSTSMKFFENQILSIGKEERHLLADIIAEARNAFSSRLDDPFLQELTRSAETTFGSEQLLKLYLEQLLILIIRQYFDQSTSQLKTTSVKTFSESASFDSLLLYLENHINSHLTIEHICRDNLISRSQLQKLFKNHTGMGIIEYFSNMKIQTAKHSIRNNHLNFTQISEQLGYTSVHYFSRQFKKLTGMTPSEYASSIKAISEGNQK
ncbi:MAG: helix-turn-helix domain-containing protein [Lachnospiraceae bacterium]